MQSAIKLSGLNSDIDEEILWEVEDNLSGKDKKGSHGGKERGEKTSNAIRKQNREDAERQRKEDAIVNIKKELEHFPQDNLSEEKMEELVHEYAGWVLKSLNQNYPFFNDLDKDIDYSQSRSSGPGGQNVNKTSTAVTARHNLTGIYVRSEDSREMLVNKKESLAKLLEKLERHVGNWRIYLRGESLNKDILVESFVKDLIKEKS